MVGIIIVTFNSKVYIDDCFRSLFKSTYKKYKVFLVDNNSSDETVIHVKKKYPTVTVFALQKNTGFAAGNNFGIKKAIKAGCKYILLINPDTITDKKCLESLLAKANNYTILQPLVLIHNGKKKTQLINTSGGVLHYLGFSYCSDYRKNARTIKEDKDIAVASGAAMFIPVSIIKGIGYFDDAFFMYYEDVDLSWRARIYGYNVKLIPNALVWHKYSFSKNKQKYYHSEKNRLLYLLHNFSLKYLLLILPVFIITEILMIIYSIISGWFLLKIKSYITILNILSKEVKIRRKNQKNIINIEKILKKYLNTELSFTEVDNPLFLPYNIILKIYWRIIYLLI